MRKPFLSFFVFFFFISRLRDSNDGAAITASLDGKQYMQVEDSTFPAAGMIGLWTKADAAAAFDDFIIQEIKE
ncbi:MAG: hypothetical protein AB1656_21510 [Candidatus Omnitrophota bacterium]